MVSPSGANWNNYITDAFNSAEAAALNISPNTLKSLEGYAGAYTNDSIKRILQQIQNVRKNYPPAEQASKIRELIDNGFSPQTLADQLSNISGTNVTPDQISQFSQDFISRIQAQMKRDVGV